MIRTVYTSGYISAQGLLVATGPNNTATVDVGGRKITGTLVGTPAIAA